MSRRALAPALLVLLACGSPAREPGGPNVLLVTLDTTRADRLGAMGDEGAQTPHLDSLAARGVLFERAYAGVPLTLPSHATLLTGLAVHEHGVRDNGRFRLAASIETLAARLTTRGYHTGAVVAAYVLDAAFGLDRGFASYDDEVAASGSSLDFSVPARSGAEVTERGLAWLGEHGHAPFFLWLHYYDAHLPRAPPAPFDAFADPYAGALAYVDTQLGLLFQGMEHIADETLIVVIGDHGEALGDHEETSHGILVYDATLHVPLLIAGPGFAPGVRSDRFVSTLDVAPTILRAVGEPGFENSRGAALQDVLAGIAPDGRSHLFESRAPALGLGWSALSGIRNEEWKLTVEPEPAELYDVRADPHETENVAGERPDVVAKLRALHTSALARDVGLAPPAALAPAARTRLAALGYLQESPPALPEAPDPRRYVAALALVERGRGLAAEGRLAEALALLEALATTPVLRARALPSLALVYRSAGRTDDAIGAARAWLDLAPSEEARRLLAIALLDAGRPEEALAVLESETARDQALASEALRRLGRLNDAEAAARAALASAPRDDAALTALALARAARDGAATELPRLTAQLADEPELARFTRARALRAELLRQTGRDGDARRSLDAGAETAPEHRVLLARIDADHGRLESAASQLERAVAARPGEAAWRLELAGILGRLARHADAVALYDGVLAVRPDDASLHLDRGAAAARLERWEDAERDFARALALAPELPEAHLNLAQLALRRGDEPVAIERLERAVALRPDYAKAHLLLARVLGARGDPRAGHHAERALALERSPAVDTGRTQPR